MSKILLYHGSKVEVAYPEIRITKYTKDFSWGFYCTNDYKQAYRWADRRSENGVVNVYKYIENPQLNILRFSEMTDEWLDFIARCRKGESHSYDIVEDIWQMIQYGILLMGLCQERFPEMFSGNMQNSDIRHIKLVFIRSTHCAALPLKGVNLFMTEKQKDNVYYVCCLIEFIARKTKITDRMSFSILQRKI